MRHTLLLVPAPFESHATRMPDAAQKQESNSIPPLRRLPWARSKSLGVWEKRASTCFEQARDATGLLGKRSFRAALVEVRHLVGSLGPRQSHSRSRVPVETEHVPNDRCRSDGRSPGKMPLLPPRWKSRAVMGRSPLARLPSAASALVSEWPRVSYSRRPLLGPPSQPWLRELRAQLQLQRGVAYAPLRPISMPSAPQHSLCCLGSRASSQRARV